MSGERSGTPSSFASWTASHCNSCGFSARARPCTQGRSSFSDMVILSRVRCIGTFYLSDETRHDRQTHGIIHQVCCVTDLLRKGGTSRGDDMSSKIKRTRKHVKPADDRSRKPKGEIVVVMP